MPRSEGEDATAAPHLRDPDLPLFRDEVVSREDFGGYSLVRIRRVWIESERENESRWYLLTPRRVFECNRECRRNIESIDWLLGHLSGSVTPDYIFPLSLGLSWRRGGRPDLDGDYRTWSSFEVIEVPSGRFERTIRVTSSGRDGRENVFFSGGLGVVLERIDGATHTTFHALMDYRIIP